MFALTKILLFALLATTISTASVTSSAPNGFSPACKDFLNDLTQLDAMSAILSTQITSQNAMVLYLEARTTSCPLDSKFEDTSKPDNSLLALAYGFFMFCNETNNDCSNAGHPEMHICSAYRSALRYQKHRLQLSLRQQDYMKLGRNWLRNRLTEFCSHDEQHDAALDVSIWKTALDGYEQAVQRLENGIGIVFDAQDSKPIWKIPLVAGLWAGAAVGNWIAGLAEQRDLIGE